MMGRQLLATLCFALLGLAGRGAAQYADENHIRVFLFGSAAYFSEVAVDVYNASCLSLDNNLWVGTCSAGGRR